MVSVWCQPCGCCPSCWCWNWLYEISRNTSKTEIVPDFQIGRYATWGMIEALSVQRCHNSCHLFSFRRHLEWGNMGEAFCQICRRHPSSDALGLWGGWGCVGEEGHVCLISTQSPEAHLRRAHCDWPIVCELDKEVLQWCQRGSGDGRPLTAWIDECVYSPAQREVEAGNQTQECFLASVIVLVGLFVWLENHYVPSSAAQEVSHYGWKRSLGGLYSHRLTNPSHRFFHWWRLSCAKIITLFIVCVSIRPCYDDCKTRYIFASIR